MPVCNKLDRDFYPKSKDCPLPILVCYHEKFVNASNLEKTVDMNSRTPIIYTTAGRNASKAIPIQFDSWQLIDWEQAIRIVKKLQRRIVKAVKAGRWKRVRDLQRLLTNSMAAKALAVRRVTENKGKKTAGIDKVLWDNPKVKAKAISQLENTKYCICRCAATAYTIQLN